MSEEEANAARGRSLDASEAVCWCPKLVRRSEIWYAQIIQGIVKFDMAA